MKKQLIIITTCLAAFVTTTAFCMDEEKDVLTLTPRPEQVKILGQLDTKEVLSINFLMELNLQDYTSSSTKMKNRSSTNYTKDLAAKANVSFYCGDGAIEYFLGKLSIEVPNGEFEKTIIQKYTLALTQEEKKFNINNLKFWLIRHTQDGDRKFSCERKKQINKQPISDDQEIKITATEKRHDNFEIFFPGFF